MPGHPYDPAGSASPPIEPLHSASGVLAVCKPAGLATQAPPGCDSLERRVREEGRLLDTGGYLGLPHRLDRPVGGIVLLATTPRAARKLSRQFERREIVKHYRGLLEPAAGASRPRPGELWRDWLAKVPDEPRARVTTVDDPAAREAVTRVRVVTDAGSRLDVLLEPTTGRMHQLRIQAASRGLPIAGDRLYGAAGRWEQPADPRAATIGLAATAIEFTDPDTLERVMIRLEPPWAAG